MTQIKQEGRMYDCGHLLSAF